jgi:hypothetical protein
MLVRRKSRHANNLIIRKCRMLGFCGMLHAPVYVAYAAAWGREKEGKEKSLVYVVQPQFFST